MGQKFEDPCGSRHQRPKPELRRQAEADPGEAERPRYTRALGTELHLSGEKSALDVAVLRVGFPGSLPSLGTMFLTMKASQEPGVKTSFQGWRMSLAEESLGCHFCRALASLLRMGE